MRRRDSSRAIRILAGIMGIMMLVMLLFSAWYTAAEADHDCSGEHCHICACLRWCEAILHHVLHVAASMSLLRSSLLPLLMAVAFASLLSAQETPITRRVRLNN